MADDSDNPDDAAERLEAALERIARLADRPRPVAMPEQAQPDTAHTAEIAARIDLLIEKLRAALDGRPD